MKTGNVRAVIQPSHYQGFTNGAQPIDIAEHLGFNLGNVIKYVARAGKKDDRLQDLRKAEYYLQREIQRQEEE
nr:MAG TPA: nucelotide kinase [Caudoviricetes sp.]